MSEDASGDIQTNPDEVLASKMIDALIESKLLPMQDRNKVFNKMKAGRANEGDWTMWAEKMVERGSDNGEECEKN